MNLTQQQLIEACQSRSAIRIITQLVPVGGDGDKVFPPTYEGGKYAFESRTTADGHQTTSVLLDAVQSQANRFEEILERDPDAQLPVFRLTIPGHDPVSSLSAPHRVYDAIMRASLYGDTEFRSSKVGERIIAARPSNATALFEYAPNVLIFGGWDSQTGSVQAAKFARAVTSEVVADNVSPGVRTSSRLDPLPIAALPVIVKGKGGDWKLDPEAKKAAKPSEIGLGNITPTITEGGVTFQSAKQTTVISLVQLRKLSFPNG